MNREHVMSSNIASIGWEEGTLEVAFRNGGIYQYAGISEAVHREFMNAASKGRYFDRYIKDHYAFREVA